METKFNSKDMASFGAFILNWHQKGMLETDSNETPIINRQHVDNWIIQQSINRKTMYSLQGVDYIRQDSDLYVYVRYHVANMPNELKIEFDELSSYAMESRLDKAKTKKCKLQVLIDEMPEPSILNVLLEKG